MQGLWGYSLRVQGLGLQGLGLQGLGFLGLMTEDL